MPVVVEGEGLRRGRVVEVGSSEVVGDDVAVVGTLVGAVVVGAGRVEVGRLGGGDESEVVGLDRTGGATFSGSGGGISSGFGAEKASGGNPWRAPAMNWCQIAAG